MAVEYETTELTNFEPQQDCFVLHGLIRQQRGLDCSTEEDVSSEERAEVTVSCSL